MMFMLLAAAATAQPALREELEPLRFLVGHCWRGEFSQQKAQDMHCFETLFDGQHVRDRHEVTGPPAVYRGETVYSWNGKLGRVEYSYWNSLGGVSHGTMTPQPGRLDFGDQSYTGPDGKQMTISTFWRTIDETSYETVAASQANPAGDRVVRYRRVD
jgi:hypothetical protein